eukprot:m.44872 g.44872  ORF g.44872 m.44872 type:complete len:74 (+) comp10639_c0_seq3:331-552(+)
MQVGNKNNPFPLIILLSIIKINKQRVLLQMKMQFNALFAGQCHQILLHFLVAQHWSQAMPLHGAEQNNKNKTR